MKMDAADSPMTLSAACLRTVGERLAYLRRRAGLTLHDAAGHSALSKSELSRLENNGRRLKDHHIDALARAYQVAPAALRALILHEPQEADVQGDQFLPCYEAAALSGKGPARAQPRMMRLPMALKLGADAYMIAVGSSDALPVPARSLVVIDPAARTVLGDLAANVADWQPPLVILRRDDTTGELTGNTAGLSVHQFHKAVAVFSGSHFAVAEI